MPRLDSSTVLHFQHFIIIIIIIIIMDSSTVLHFQYFILTSSGRIYAPRRDLAQRLSEENGDAATHSVWRIIDSRDKKIRFGREACVATGSCYSLYRVAQIAVEAWIVA